MSEEKKTFIERMFDRFFSAQARDPKGFILVIVVMYSIWITKLYVDQNEVLNGKIVEEVRKQVKPAVQEQLEPIKQRVDTTTQVVKDVSTNIDNFMKKHE